MSLENLNLGQLVKMIVKKELFKYGFSRGITIPGKTVSSYERQKLSEMDNDLKEFYDEIGRREQTYRTH